MHVTNFETRTETISNHDLLTVFFLACLSAMFVTPVARDLSYYFGKDFFSDRSRDNVLSKKEILNSQSGIKLLRLNQEINLEKVHRKLTNMALF